MILAACSAAQLSILFSFPTKPASCRSLAGYRMFDDVEQGFAAGQPIQISGDHLTAAWPQSIRPSRRMRSHDDILQFAEGQIRWLGDCIPLSRVPEPGVDHRTADALFPASLEQCAFVDQSAA